MTSGELLDRAADDAAALAALPAVPYATTKQLVNRPLIERLTASIS